VSVRRAQHRLPERRIQVLLLPFSDEDEWVSHVLVAPVFLHINSVMRQTLSIASAFQEIAHVWL
jgi:hypothetical protein